MKQKMTSQVQARESSALRNRHVQAEINTFLKALGSYPAEAAKEPTLSFRRHLRSFAIDPVAPPRRG